MLYAVHHSTLTEWSTYVPLTRLKGRLCWRCQNFFSVTQRPSPLTMTPPTMDQATPTCSCLSRWNLHWALYHPSGTSWVKCMQEWHILGVGKGALFREVSLQRDSTVQWCSTLLLHSFCIVTYSFLLSLKKVKFSNSCSVLKFGRASLAPSC